MRASFQSLRTEPGKPKTKRDDNMNTLGPAQRLDLMQETRVNSPDGMVETTADGRVNILFDRHLGHPLARVWQALTSLQKRPAG